jgi:gliding motility-associated-like protein
LNSSGGFRVYSYFCKSKKNRMKKTYLLLLFILSAGMLSAQVTMYEHETRTMSEATIEELVQQARQNGTEEWEITKFRVGLQKQLAAVRHAQEHPEEAAKYAPVYEVQQACTNIDFEQGNYTGWTLTNGNINNVSLPCNTCANTAGGVANMTASGTTFSNLWTNGIDNCSGQPVVAPGGGNFSLCLNNKTAGGKMQKIRQTFTVSNTNNIFTFQYLAVLQTGGTSHSASQQPYFQVRVLDQNNNTIPCTNYYAAATGSISGWTNGTCGTGVSYKGWVTITIDLTAYLNTNVTIEYVVSDCNLGGHWGYAYIDGSCGVLNYTNNAGICNGQNAQLCGPTGYASYTWNGPVSGTGQCLTTGTAGIYTLTTTSSLGCASPTLTYTVTASPSPTANFSVATSPCSLTANFTDLSTVSSGSISNWSWNFGNGQSATSTTPGNTQSNTYSSGGTYNVVLTTTTSAGCVASFTAPVTIQAPLSAVALTSSVSCNGGNNGTATALPSGGGGGYTYSWSPNGGTSSTAGGLAAGTYTVLVTDANSCTTTATATVNQPTAVAATSSFTAALCGQSNGVASVSASGGSGSYTYTWVPNGGNGPTASGLVAGNYTCNITDSKGCPLSVTVNVPNTIGPSLSVTSTSSVTCFGGNDGSGTVNGTGGTGALTYSWSPSGGSSTTASSLSAGTYTAVVTDANGCSTNTVITITEPTDITATNSVSSTACGLSNGTATVTASGGMGSYTYSWSPSGGTANTASNLSAGGYTCTITDANGCVEVVPMVITTSTGPSVAVVTSNSVTCFGGNDGGATISASGGGGTYSYTWTPAGGNTPTASGLPAGTYSCIVADQNGCIDITSVTIAQPAAITSSISSSNVNCNGGSNGTASVSASGGTGALTYSWSPAGGSASTASNLAAGTYTCLITDNSGCTNTATVSITQPPALSITIGSSPAICNGAANGTATVSVSGGTNPYTYNWFPSGGTNATAVGLSPGSYTCGIVDSKGCVTAISTTITEPPAVLASGSTTDITCNGQLNGSATVTVTNNVGTTTYTWSPVGGNNQTASNLGPGTYSVTVKDANGCTGGTSVTISQPTAVNTTVSVTPITCNGGTNGSATVTATGGVGPYSSSWNTTPVQTGTVVTNLSEGAYQVTVTDANGCVKTNNILISPPGPRDSLTATGTLCITDPSVVLSAPPGVTGPYQWYENTFPLNGDTSATYTANQGQVTSGAYAVTWFYNGCRYVTTTIAETIYQDILKLPRVNIFTPNKDNLNDEFLPFSFANAGGYTNTGVNLDDLVKTYELVIYDRWGRLMYTTTTISELWDGKTDGGKDAPDGTYYWLVRYKTPCSNSKGEEQAHGFVQLLR